ncbi:MAG: succinate dehydrogenase cytochrome b subunit [Planctomycetota bacterium]|jgi:succinate dehydrogenase / fumarate reductase cytochrome b subunit
MRGYTGAPQVPSYRRLQRIAGSSIGNKFLMAATGILLLFFLLGHLAGNLQVFLGREAVNAYAQWLHDRGGLLWTARIVLLAALLLHIYTALRLSLQNWTARPEGYRYEDTVEASWASRHMLLTGGVVFAYVVYHLLHFTFRVIDTGGMGATDAAGRLDVYGMVVQGFGHWAVASSYVAAQVVLGIHLWHAIGSVFQTLGWDQLTLRPLVRWLGPALAVLIAAGYISIPLAVWLGIVRP